MGADIVHTNCPTYNCPRYTTYRALYGSGVNVDLGSRSRALVNENRISHTKSFLFDDRTKFR